MTIYDMMMLEGFNKIQKKRYWFLRQALSFLNTPYKLGGQDGEDIDCSGLVTVSLQAIGLLPMNRDYDCDALWKHFQFYPKPRVPNPACIVFWCDSSEDYKHVAISLDDEHCISATGYDKYNRSVRIHPLNYRDGDGLEKKIVDPF